MVFFGHLGITTGVFKACEAGLNKKRKSPFDYRFILAGSLLPDLIDKPIGAVLFRGTFHNSRIFGHSLLFPAALALAGLPLMKKRKDARLLLLAGASFVHLILDSMWLFPRILFWPFLGFAFPERPPGNWAMEDLDRLLKDPAYFLPELTGLLILLFFFLRAARRKELGLFFKSGKL